MNAMNRPAAAAFASVAILVCLLAISRSRPALPAESGHSGADALVYDIAIPDAEEAASWQVEEGSIRATEGCLEWTADRAGSTIGRNGVVRDWTAYRALRLRLHSAVEAPVSFEVQAQLESGARFWRKIAVVGAGWHSIVVPLYQFRRTGAPRWTRVDRFAVSARQAGKCRIDAIELVAAAEGEDPLVEPDAELIRRAFPGIAAPRLYRNARFRVACGFEIDGERLVRRLDELEVRFRRRLGLAEEAGPPATLVIFREAEDYRKFAESTARDVYAASLGPVTADGYTFLDYSISSWSDAHKEDRPVYVHEVCHQLISRRLRIEEEQKWVQEGFAAWMQMEMLSEEERAQAAGGIRRLAARSNRVPLGALDARFVPKTPQYLQFVSLVAFLAAAPEWPKALAAIQRGASLREVVEGPLETDLQTFERRWLAFCGDWR
jgi:hypothetical protein